MQNNARAVQSFETQREQTHGGDVERLEEIDKILGARTSSWMEIRGTPSQVEKNQSICRLRFRWRHCQQEERHRIDL